MSTGFLYYILTDPVVIHGFRKYDKLLPSEMDPETWLKAGSNIL